MRSDLKRYACREAAEWLESGCDAFDLDPKLSVDEEEQVREYIRGKLAKELRHRSLDGFKNPEDKP